MIAAFVAVATMSTRVQSRPQFSPRLIGFDVTEATIYNMQTAMQRFRVTSKELVLQSLARIAIYKTTLNRSSRASAPRISHSASASPTSTAASLA